MMKWASRKVGCLVVICSPRMGSCLVGSSRVVSTGYEMEGPGSHWVLWRMGVLQGPVQVERAGLCPSLALVVADPICLCHMTCPAPVLQGSLTAATKYGESSTEILSFCLKQTNKQKQPPHTHNTSPHCCITAALIYCSICVLDWLFMLSVAGWLLLEAVLFGVWPCLH